MKILIPYDDTRKNENYHFTFEPKLAEDYTPVVLNMVGIREGRNDIVSITKNEKGIQITIDDKCEIKIIKQDEEETE